MRYINKAGGGGTAWDKFAATKDARFKTAPKEAIDGLRRTLARQQGYLCAFCMARLAFVEEADGSLRHKTKLAHLISQAVPAGADATETLRRQRLETDQHNLVLACMGQSSPYSHCDDKQGSRDVSIQFENAGFMQGNFSFLRNGLVKSGDADVRIQIGAEREADDRKSTLNLNNPLLCRWRREAVENLARVMQQTGDYSLSNLTAKLNHYTQPDLTTGRLPAYCEFLAHVVSKKIERNQQ